MGSDNKTLIVSGIFILLLLARNISFRICKAIKVPARVRGKIINQLINLFAGLRTGIRCK